MKFIISRTELFNQLQLMEKVMPTKASVPILENVLFTLSNDKLTLMASNLETSLVAELAVANVQEEGSVAVPHDLISWLKAQPEQPLTITVDEQTFQIKIVTATGNSELAGFDPQEFPKIPDVEKVSAISFPAATLSDGLSKTTFATSDDPQRLPAMTGIYFDMSGDYATFVSTDSHKLVRYRRPDVKVENHSSFILPKKPAMVLSTIIAKESGTVDVCFDGKNASFVLPGYTLVCRLIDANFPAYASVIPANNLNKVEVDRVELLNAVKRTATLAPTTTELIRIKLTGNQITISAQDIDYARGGAERLTCQYEGEEMEIGFKASYLVALLENLGMSDVRIELSAPQFAGLFLPIGEDVEKEDTLMLLMPMSIDTGY
jgi:DNA polymerase-3 subunit beta